MDGERQSAIHLSMRKGSGTYIELVTARREDCWVYLTSSHQQQAPHTWRRAAKDHPLELGGAGGQLQVFRGKWALRQGLETLGPTE